jgi:probable F420-dependent oxidoreductase
MHLDAALPFDVGLAEAGDLAIAAERAGIDALWSAETSHDPFLPLPAVAAATSRLHFGTAVAVAFARSPVATAMTAWDLARASNGRFILGLGSQVRAHVERRFAAPWSGRPVAQLREYVVVVRAAWEAWQTGTRPAFRGEHFRFTLMTPFFDPGPIDQPGIPIYLAGVAPPMLRLAGEVADGLLVHPLHSPAYLAEVIRPAVEEGARLADRSVADVALAPSVIVALDEGEIPAARRTIAFYASTPSYRPVLEHHGWGEVAATLSEHARRGRWEEMAALIDDRMLEAFAVVADWETIGARLLARYAVPPDRIWLYRPFTPEHAPAWRSLARTLRGDVAANPGG